MHSPSRRQRILLSVEALEERALPSVGNLDPLFGNSGFAVLPALGNATRVNDVAVVRDNVDTTADPILLAGASAQGFFVARLDATGVLGGFGTGGVVNAGFGPGSEANALTIRNNLVVAGGTVGPVGARDLALARFNMAGTLDDSFSGDGRQTLDLGADDVLKTVAVLADNSVVAVGTTTGAGGHDIFIARFNGTGTLTSSAVIDLGGDDEANALSVNADGSVFIAGATTRAHANGVNRDFALVKVTAGNTLDGTFGVGGISTLDFGGALPGGNVGTPVANPAFDDAATGVAVQGGKVVVAGRANNGRFDFLALARFNANGTLDTTFAPGAGTFGPVGTITTAVGPSSDIAFDLTVQPSGEFVVAGRALRNEINLDQSDFTLARYNADGTPDTTFGFEGRLATFFPAGFSEAHAIDFDDNGTLVVAGVLHSGADSFAAVTRYQADIRPVAQGNSFTVASDGFSEPINIAPLDNDFDPDQGDRLTIVKLTARQGDGTVDVLPGVPQVLAEGTLETDGTTIRFTPRNNFSSPFSFTYVVSDGWLTTSSHVDINVVVGPERRAGDRDPDFGSVPNRVVSRLDFNPSSAAAAVKLGSDTVIAGTVVVTQPDGSTRTVVGLARYDDNGQLVSSFGTNGFTLLDLNLGTLSVAALTVQNVAGEDRLVVAGTVDTNLNPSVTNNDYFAARFGADGSVDTSFGVNGVRTVDLGGSDLAAAILAVPAGDGNDLIIGGTTDAPGTVVQDFGLVRLAADGTQDITFGLGGTVLTDLRQADVLRALALENGKIVAVGAADLLATGATGRDMALARYNLDGTPDLGFGTMGKRTQDFTLRDDAFAVTVDPGTNDLLVAGFVAPDGVQPDNRDLAVARFAAADGSLVTTFGTDGLATVDFAGQRDEARSALLNGGKLFVGGIASVFNPHSITPGEPIDYGLAILDPDSGAILNISTTDFVGRNDVLTALVPAGTGVIAVGSAFDRDSTLGMGLVKFDDTGTVDPSFGGPIPGFGEVFRAPGDVTMPSAATAVVVQSGDRIVAGGFASQNGQDFALVRYLADGRIDTSFGNAGTVLLDVFFSGGDDRIAGLINLPGDGLLAAGTATRNGHTVFAVAKLDSSGQIDDIFGDDGVATVDFGTDAEATGIVRDSLGRLFVSGFVMQNGRRVLALAELSDSGIMTGLDGDGMVTLDLGVDAEARGIAVQDDKIVLAGSAGGDLLLARFNLDGTLDTSFNATGMVLRDVGGQADGLTGVTVDLGGRIIASGFSTNPSGNTDFLALRVLDNGTFDHSFGTGGDGLVILSGFGTGNDAANALTLQEVAGEQRIVLAGVVTFSGQQVFGLARLTSTGLLDTTFGTNGLVRTFLSAGPALANAVTVDGEGQLVVAGSGVTTVGGPSRFAVFRYRGEATGNFPPLTVPDTATTAEGQPITIPVLQNDQDANGNELFIVPGSIARQDGTLTGAIDITYDGKSLIYTPPVSGGGFETFTYQVSDGSVSVPATVTINTVAAPNIAPALTGTGISIDSLKFLAIGGPNADGIFTRPVDGVAPGPNGFVHLTTGDRAIALDGTRSGVDNGNALGGNRTGGYDATIIQVDLTVTAADANFLSFDFAFLTNEYPGLVSRSGNDSFVAELYDLGTAPDGPSFTIDPVDGQVLAPDNFAFDAQDQDHPPPSVRGDFFSDDRVVTLTGTLYNGGTPFLRAGEQVQAGHRYRLFLSIFDVGDQSIGGQIDSAVFLHNLQATHVDPAAVAGLRGAVPGPVAGDDWLPLAGATVGVPINVPVLDNDIAFDGDAVQIISVGAADAGIVTLVDSTHITYTPTSLGDDSFTYTIRDSRGLTSTATVSVFSAVSRTSSLGAAPGQGRSVSTSFVSQGMLTNNGVGSPSTPFTLSDYTGNPTAVPIDPGNFFDVLAPNSGPTDRVELIVNDPTGKGELFYFNGSSWQPVRSSGGLPPERLPDGRLRIILDGFSFPRVNFLFGTPFSIPVPTANPGGSVSNASAGPGTTSSNTTFRSDVSASLSLTSISSTQVRESGSSESLRLSLQTGEGQGASGGSAGSGGAASGGDSDAQVDAELDMDLLWIMELNPDLGNLLLDVWQQEGKLTPGVLARLVPPPLGNEAFATAPTDMVPTPGPEEEQEAPEDPPVLDFLKQGPEVRPEWESEEVPCWAWAALAGVGGPFLRPWRVSEPRRGASPARSRRGRGTRSA